VGGAPVERGMASTAACRGSDRVSSSLDGSDDQVLSGDDAMCSKQYLERAQTGRGYLGARHLFPV
jgi:hypothetical protein